MSSGAVDPLSDIAAICRRHDLWFHVDGAYGAFAATVANAPVDLLALSEADSVTVDPHKWLYTPLEAGCVLVRDPRHLRDAFAYHPPYYRFSDEVINYFDSGLQNSRGFRALKVWLALKHVGRQGCVQMISDDIRLAEAFFTLVEARPELDALSHGLSIVCFRYVPPDLRSQLGEPEVESYLNRLNEDLLARVERSGKAFFSNAVLGGVYALRLCIVNFRTSLEDIEMLPALVARLGASADAELRPEVTATQDAARPTLRTSR